MPIPDGEQRITLLPCPFCGASGHTYLHKYPNGEVNPNTMIWHDDDCPLKYVIECFDYYPDEQALADAWTKRWDNA